MNENITASPLTWPEGVPRTPTEKRKRSAFGRSTRSKPSVGKASESLVEELDKIGIKDNDVIISTNLELRRDGYPRPGQPEPSDCGIAVWWWESDGNPTPSVLPIDIWDRVGCNIHAAFKSLEAIRGVERWGGANTQKSTYKGFKQLVAPGREQPWRDVLGYRGDSIKTLESLYRELRSKHHPDKGGDIDTFQRIQTAIAQGREALGA